MLLLLWRKSLEPIRLHQPLALDLDFASGHNERLGDVDAIRFTRFFVR